MPKYTVPVRKIWHRTETTTSEAMVEVDAATPEEARRLAREIAGTPGFQFGLASMPCSVVVDEIECREPRRHIPTRRMKR